MNYGDNLYPRDAHCTWRAAGRIGRVQALAGSILEDSSRSSKWIRRMASTSTVGKERTHSQSAGGHPGIFVGSIRQLETPLQVSVMHGQFAEQAKILLDMKCLKKN
jgi:hypothetical protein